MTTKITSVSEDKMQMIIIVVLVGAILYMLTQRSGGICSLVNPRERFAIGAADCEVGDWFHVNISCDCPNGTSFQTHPDTDKSLKRCIKDQPRERIAIGAADCKVGDWFDVNINCDCPNGTSLQRHADTDKSLKRCIKDQCLSKPWWGPGSGPDGKCDLKTGEWVGKSATRSYP